MSAGRHLSLVSFSLAPSVKKRKHLPPLLPLRSPTIWARRPALRIHQFYARADAELHPLRRNGQDRAPNSSSVTQNTVVLADDDAPDETVLQGRQIVGFERFCARSGGLAPHRRIACSKIVAALGAAAGGKGQLLGAAAPQLGDAGAAPPRVAGARN